MDKPILHILIIEDNQDDVELMMLELKKANGFEIVFEVVQDEKSLRAAFEKKSWDIVFCDYKMPSFKAERALEISKALAPYTRFIVVSGSISQDIGNQMIRQGAHDYVGKDMIARLIPAIRLEFELYASRDELLNVLSVALEYKDWTTHGHSQRVTNLTVQLARVIGVREVEIVHIRRGALLHDVGKIGIADSILLKRGTLTPGERTEMERHPQLAYDMLKPVRFLSPALDIPYCHHERWDGSGYPRNLAGSQIPFSARIFAVIDVYDALTTVRPYRESLSSAEALAYLHEQSGTLFDRAVVEVFLRMMEEV